MKQYGGSFSPTFCLHQRHLSTNSPYGGDNFRLPFEHCRWSVLTGCVEPSSEDPRSCVFFVILHPLFLNCSIIYLYQHLRHDSSCVDRRPTTAHIFLKIWNQTENKVHNKFRISLNSINCSCLFVVSCLQVLLQEQSVAACFGPEAGVQIWTNCNRLADTKP
jgi:hypothetical protein